MAPGSGAGLRRKGWMLVTGRPLDVASRYGDVLDRSYETR